VAGRSRRLTTTERTALLAQIRTALDHFWASVADQKAEGKKGNVDEATRADSA